MFRSTLIPPAFLVALLATPWAAAYPLELRVRDVRIDEFPRVSAVFSLWSPAKLDFRNLQPDDVRVLEEEVRVRHQTLVPDDTQLAIALVLDDSGSQDSTLRLLKEAVYRLVDQMRPHDAASVIGFARGAGVIAPLTTDRRLIRDAASRLVAYGASALYDGVALGLSEVYRAPGKRVVLVVTDGRDEVYPGGHPLSRATVGDLVHIARGHGIEVYAIGIGPMVRHGVLRTLTGHTGGSYWHAPDHGGVRTLFADLSRSLSARYRVAYDSPRPIEDPSLREVRIDVDFRGHRGSDVFGYQVRERSDAEAVVVKRTNDYTPPTGDLQVFTTGLRGTHLPMRFYVLDAQNHLARLGTTSPDGYGKLDARDPQTVKLHPGTYRLEIEQLGTTMRHVHPGIEVRRGQTTVVRYKYSKLVFRRNARAWYDTPHAYGDTSDLVAISIVNGGDGRTVYSGRLIDFKEPRETAVWLEEGRFGVDLSNLWPPSKWPEVERAVLRNKLQAPLEVFGSRVLYFDVVDADLIIDPDVLAQAAPPRGHGVHEISPAGRRVHPGGESQPPRSYYYRSHDLQTPPAPSGPERAEGPPGPADPVHRLEELARSLEGGSPSQGKLLGLARSMDRSVPRGGTGDPLRPARAGPDGDQTPDGPASPDHWAVPAAQRPVSGRPGLAAGARPVQVGGGVPSRRTPGRLRGPEGALSPSTLGSPSLGTQAAGGAGPRQEADRISARLRELSRPRPALRAADGPGTGLDRPRRGRVFFGTEFLLRSYRKANPFSMLVDPSEEPSTDAGAPQAPTRRVKVSDARAGRAQADPLADLYRRTVERNARAPTGGVRFETDEALRKAMEEARERRAVLGR